MKAVALVGERIPMVCTVTDVCRILGISATQFYELRKTSRFPIPELRPRLGRGPRFSGVDVQLYLENGFAAKRSA